MAEVNKSITDAYDLSMAAQVGCDSHYQGREEEIKKCYQRLGNASSGKNEPVKDTDRDADGIDDAYDDDDGVGELRKIAAYLNTYTSEKCGGEGYKITHGLCVKKDDPRLPGGDKGIAPGKSGSFLCDGGDSTGSTIANDCLNLKALYEAEGCTVKHSNEPLYDPMDTLVIDCR